MPWRPASSEPSARRAFRLDYAKIAADQASDQEVQANRTAITSLQLSDIQFDCAMNYRRS